MAERNVSAFQRNERSLLWLYRRLISLRLAERALMEGDYVPLRSRNDIHAFKRHWNDEELLIALNTVPEPRRLLFED